MREAGDGAGGGGGELTTDTATAVAAAAASASAAVTEAAVPCDGDAGATLQHDSGCASTSSAMSAWVASRSDRVRKGNGNGE